LVDEDVRLMLAFQGGDERAFGALFERWGGRVLRFLERMVGEAGVAEDLVQETFLRVWRARERYQPEARFSTWLFTIAGNAARNELRRPFRRAAHESVDDDAEGAPLALAADDPPSDELVDARRTGAGLEAALAELPERQREALWLRAVEGLSYAEVAEALATSEKSVKALIHRARVALARETSRAVARGARR
jgi:RNA polymerase sigma-70 factor (ECF subfamily)